LGCDISSSHILTRTAFVFRQQILLPSIGHDSKGVKLSLWRRKQIQRLKRRISHQNDTMGYVQLVSILYRDETKFGTVAPICFFTVWNLFHVALLW